MSKNQYEKEKELGQLSFELFNNKYVWKKILREGWFEWKTETDKSGNERRVMIKTAATMEDVEKFMLDLKNRKNKILEEENAKKKDS